MPGSIIHESASGETFMETYIGDRLAVVTTHEDKAEAIAAWSEAVEGREGVINDGIQITEAELKAEKEASLDIKYPWRHEHPVKIALRGLAYSLTHYGRPQ